jgi:acyl-CoA synthetase (AMP-forming)/AMP-acid ligase II
LCLNKITETDLKGLDLSSLRMVANGAEPVSVQTLRRFIERFGHYGFRTQAMAPVYGLAECSVGLAFPPIGRTLVVDRVSRDQLSAHGRAEPALPEDARAIEIVACGQPLPGHEIRIVDEAGHELGERREGRLEFRGPSATKGYFNNEIKTRELLRDGWLDSGDRGYIAGGDVYITGRIKDIVIRAGRHLYPQEIEEAVAGIPGIHKGGVAVFGVTDRASGTERVVIIAETRETDVAADGTALAPGRSEDAFRAGVTEMPQPLDLGVVDLVLARSLGIKVKTTLWHALTHNMVLHVASARADDHGRHQGLAGLDTRKFAMPIRQILARPAASAIGPSSARVLGDERL